jgi:hypothetical protein
VIVCRDLLSQILSYSQAVLITQDKISLTSANADNAYCLYVLFVCNCILRNTEVKDFNHVINSMSFNKQIRKGFGGYLIDLLFFLETDT